MIKIASEFQILQFMRTAYGNHQQKYFGFYSSLFNQIITDQQYMLLPVDERTATRAHGVFDVVYLKNYRLINFDKHISRLYKSAESASIHPPFDQQRTKQIVIEVVENIVDHHLRNDPLGKNKKIMSQHLCIRITISSGYGDFGICSSGKKPILYIMVFEPYFSDGVMTEGVNEYVTQIVEKPKDKVHSKTIDYIDNAIMANLAKEKGGYQGIKALKNGVLLEAAAANIGFIFGKEFAAPRFQTVIEGTTIKLCLTFLESLVKEGTLDKISLRDITIQEGEKADEMIVFGGDKVVPVLKFNDKTICEKRGPITKRLQEWYSKAIGEGTPIKVSENLL